MIFKVTSAVLKPVCWWCWLRPASAWLQKVQGGARWTSQTRRFFIHVSTRRRMRGQVMLNQSPCSSSKGQPVRRPDSRTAPERRAQPAKISKKARSTRPDPRAVLRGAGAAGRARAAAAGELAEVGGVAADGVDEGVAVQGRHTGVSSSTRSHARPGRARARAPMTWLRWRSASRVRLKVVPPGMPSRGKWSGTPGNASRTVGGQARRTGRRSPGSPTVGEASSRASIRARGRGSPRRL